MFAAVPEVIVQQHHDVRSSTCDYYAAHFIMFAAVPVIVIQ
jgi:hypothetical protein